MKRPSTHDNQQLTRPVINNLGIGGQKRIQATSAVAAGVTVTITLAHQNDQPENPLSLEEQSDFAHHESIIQHGLQTFVEVGQSLAVIRDRRLYRAQFHTFEAYCEERWRCCRSYAYRLINAASIASHLLTIGDIPKPTRESQVRPMVGLPPLEIEPIWVKAVALANGKPIAAKHVKSAICEIYGKPSRPCNGAKVDYKVLKIVSTVRLVSDLLREAEKSISEQMGLITTMNLLRRIGKLTDEILKEHPPTAPRSGPD